MSNTPPPSKQDDEDFEAFRVSDPPCECQHCQDSFYTTKAQKTSSLAYIYRSRTNDLETFIIAARYFALMKANRDYITQRIRSHGDIVLSRWKKKREKRRSILLAAEPMLRQERWFTTGFNHPPVAERHVRDRESRYQFLLPWLDLEVLSSNAMTLLALLKYRTLYSSQDWAVYDSQAMKASWKSGMFDVQFSPRCMVMHGSQYGAIVDWEVNAAHRFDIIGWPRAQLLLEAQTNLLCFLRATIDKILEGIDLDKPAGSERWEKLTAVDFKNPGEIESWSSYTHQAFSPPPSFNIEDLLSKAHAQWTALSDQLWFLQTNPGYMRRYIRISHQAEVQKFARKSKSSEVYSSVKDLHTILFMHIYWRWIIAGLEQIKTFQNRFRDSIFPGQRLPPSYNRALEELELLLLGVTRTQADALHHTYPGRPGFRDQWNFVYDGDHPEGERVVMTNKAKSPRDYYLKDRLSWCLAEMVEAEAADRDWGIDHALLSEILEEHLSKTTAAVRARLDEALYHQLSDLAAFHELLNAIRKHRPRNTNTAKLDESTPWKQVFSPKLEGQYIAYDSPEWTSVGKKLMKDFYQAELPTGEKNATWLARSRVVRGALDDVWTGIRTNSATFFRSTYGISAEEVEECMSIITASSNPEYIHAVEAEEDEIQAGIARRMKNDHVGTSVHNDWDHLASTELPSRPFNAEQRYV